MIKVDIDKGELLVLRCFFRFDEQQSLFITDAFRSSRSDSASDLGANPAVWGGLKTASTSWSKEVPAFRGMNILTPTQVGNRLLTATYGGKTHLFEPSVSESGAWQVKEQWQYKFQGYMSSPVVAGGHVYLHGRSGRMVCLDLDSEH